MLDTPKTRVFNLHLHAGKLAMAALWIPLVHTGRLVGEVEDFVGSDRIAAHRTSAVEKGSHKTITVTRFTIIDRELRINLQHAVHRSPGGYVANTDVRCMIEQHVAMDTAEAPKILILEIRTVAIFVNFDGYLVLAFFDIWCDVKFRGFHRPLRIAHTQTIHPHVESRHDTLETKESLAIARWRTVGNCGVPAIGEDKRTAVLASGVAFLVGRPILLGFTGDIRRIYLERIAGRDIDRRAVAVYLPIGRNGQCGPLRIIVIDTIEVTDTFIGRLCPTETPIAIKRQHSVSLSLTIGDKIGTCRLTIYLQHVVILPVMVRSLSKSP